MMRVERWRASLFAASLFAATLVLATLLGWEAARAQPVPGFAQFWNGYGSWRAEAGVYTDSPCVLVANYDGSDGWCLRELEPRVSAGEGERLGLRSDLTVAQGERALLEDALDAQGERLAAAEDALLALQGLPVAPALYDAEGAYTGVRVMGLGRDNSTATGLVVAGGRSYRLIGLDPSGINDLTRPSDELVDDLALYYESSDCSTAPLIRVPSPPIEPIPHVAARAYRTDWFTWYGPGDPPPGGARAVGSTHAVSALLPDDSPNPAFCAPAVIVGHFVYAVRVWSRQDWGSGPFSVR